MSRVDPAAIDELRALMGDEFGSLIDAFHTDSREQIDAIAGAIADADAEQLRRQAHGLRGACINLGANELAELCHRIEECGRAGDCAKAATLLPALRLEFESVRATLSELTTR